MFTSRARRTLAITLLGGLTLAGCGSDNAGSGASSSAARIAGQSCVAGAIKASGSTAQKNAIAAWVNAYQTACGSGSTIDYQATGSGAGIQDFINKQTAFAGSDSPLKDADRAKANAMCATGPALDIPMVGGAVVLAYNVAGVNSLILPAKVIAGIYANTIKTWNDPAITAANPGVTLPAATIAAFHRSDSSGTTDNFTKYLKNAAASAWTYDSGKEWAAPGGQGAKGSDGMANAVAATANSIAYMELSFAQNAKLAVASVDNGGGPIVPSSQTAAATISSATVTGTGNDLSLSINYTSTTGYPIVLVTYEITCEKGGDAANVPLTKAFLTYTSSDEGQGKLSAIGYVPITGDLLTKVRTSVSAISG